MIRSQLSSRKLEAPALDLADPTQPVGSAYDARTTHALSLLQPLKRSRVFRAAALAASLLATPSLVGQDADESELAQSFERVDVWHFPVDYDVGYNNQDALVSRVLVAQPAPAGELCFIGFDLIRGEGDYAYGFKPPELGLSSIPAEWGVSVKRRGTVLNQQRSVLKLNVVYFYVEGPKGGAAKDLCARKQAAPTAQAGHGYAAKDWSTLIVRARLIHGWPQDSR